MEVSTEESLLTTVCTVRTTLVGCGPKAPESDAFPLFPQLKSGALLCFRNALSMLSFANASFLPSSVANASVGCRFSHFVLCLLSAIYFLSSGVAAIH
jgi:hypothetical protein